jgi:ribosomal protein S18 acetylase RimI-like enzyme
MPDISLQCRVATPEETQFTALRLKDHTEQAIGINVSHAAFGLLAYEGETLIGSIVGKSFFNWLHIDLMWVEDSYRSQGVGRMLMDEAYRQAKEMGLSGIEVWTQSWQAPGFYKKMGYEELAVIDDFTPGRKRHVFRRLIPDASAVK